MDRRQISSASGIYFLIILTVLRLLPVAYAQGGVNDSNGTSSLDVTTQQTFMGHVKFASEPRGRGTLGIVYTELYFDVYFLYLYSRSCEHHSRFNRWL